MEHSPVTISTYSRPAYKHYYQTWRTIAIYAIVAWLLTGAALVRTITVAHDYRALAEAMK